MSAAVPAIRRRRHDAAERPFTVIWESTRACPPACRHCRAEAVPDRHPREPGTAAAKELPDQVAAFGRPAPVFVITGGDPFQRPALNELIAYGRDIGVRVAETGGIMRTQVQPDAATVESLLAAAVAAPSIHNTQPWRFRLDPESQALEVHAAPTRTLPLADPVHRAQYLSVGAAVFNLRLAAVHQGWRPEVKLLPDPHRPGLLATVRLTGPLPEDEQPSEPGLYAAIARRHTSRMPFTGRPVPEPIVAEMTAAAQAAGARLHVPDIVGTRGLLRLTATAEARNHADPDRTAETRTWITAPDTDASYGVPATALGPPDAAGRMPMRTSPADCPPSVCPPCGSNAMCSWPCCGRATTGATTGCARARLCSTSCSQRPPGGCAPRSCTRPWNGRTYGPRWPSRDTSGAIRNC